MRVFPMKSFPLPKTRATLRSIFRGEPSLSGPMLRTAELAAESDLGPTVVLNALIDRFPWVPADALLRIEEALVADLPLDDLGALVLDGFRLRAERGLA